MKPNKMVAVALALLIGGAGVTASSPGNAMPLAAATQSGAQTGDTNNLLQEVAQRRKVKRSRAARGNRATRNRAVRSNRATRSRAARGNRATRNRTVRSNRATRNRAVRSNRAVRNQTARSNRNARSNKAFRANRSVRNWRYNRSRHGYRYSSRRGNYRHYHDGYYYASPFWLGVALAAPSVAYASGHVEWCDDNYRSYNASTDTYRGYDGYDHRCISPYS